MAGPPSEDPSTTLAGARLELAVKREREADESEDVEEVKRVKEDEDLKPKIEFKEEENAEVLAQQRERSLAPTPAPDRKPAAPEPPPILVLDAPPIPSTPAPVPP
ncbi:hypothetical protein P7C70_g5182, partial [Phenoliferia sp. Uapishka_3]